MAARERVGGRFQQKSGGKSVSPKLLSMSALALVMAAAPASAATFTFTSENYNAVFTLPDSPSPADFEDGVGFALPGSGTLNGKPFASSNITFFTLFLTLLPNYSGGFSIDGTWENLFFGEQLYTGPESAPKFLAGTYDLYSALGSAEGRLVISDVGRAVPEPVSWAMMVGGFGLVGGVMRRRAMRTTVRFT
jgi:hypothetical protein